MSESIKKGLDSTAVPVGMEKSDALVNLNTITRVNELFTKLAGSVADASLEIFTIDLGERGVVLPPLNPTINQIAYLFLLTLEQQCKGSRKLAINKRSLNDDTKNFIIINRSLFKVIDGKTNNVTAIPAYKESKMDPSEKRTLLEQKYGGAYKKAPVRPNSESMIKEKENAVAMINENLIKHSPTAPQTQDKELEDITEAPTQG